MSWKVGKDEWKQHKLYGKFIKAAMTEAISDPWLERKQGFEWRGNPYTSEMVSDLMLQFIEMGYVNPSGKLKGSK